MTRSTRIASKVTAIVVIAVGALMVFLMLEEPTVSIDKETGKTTQNTDFPYASMARGFVDVEGGIIKLAASRDGIIRQVLVEEGDRVKKNQVLAIQDDREAKLNLQVAEAELAEVRSSLQLLNVRLAAARREGNRLDPLVKHGSASKRRFDELNDEIKIFTAEIARRNAMIDSAAAKRDVAAYEVEQRIIRAPMDGRILRRMARPGDGASTLNVTTLFWFVPDTPRIVRAELEEQFVEKVFAGMTAHIVPEADESRSFPARVLRIGAVFGPKRPSTYDPRERADVRVVETVLTLDAEETGLLLGQRVIAKFRKDAP